MKNSCIIAAASIGSFAQENSRKIKDKGDLRANIRNLKGCVYSNLDAFGTKICQNVRTTRGDT
jgi:hypothetical protein